MLKTAVLALTALATFTTALPAIMVTPANAGACTAGPLCLPPPPKKPNDNPDPGNDKPLPEGPEFAMDRPEMLISCRVPGDAGAQTTDLRFRNIGSALIPAGTRVFWAVNGTQGGEFFLPADLPVGKELSDADLLKLGVPARTDCLSKIA
ncbi:MAG TPA: hypothetical protein VHA07_09160 [Devosia sp.]|nr:hypothetical protein [Devosia sp.]